MIENLRAAIRQACRDTFGQDVPAELTRPNEQFGDYTTNIALHLAGKLNKPPREVADVLAEKLRERLADEVKEIDVAGPGFLNLTLTDEALSRLAQTTARRSVGEVVIETNNPNPFKAMHIGHAFNAILADTIANLLESGGRKTHRVSYHGDVGAHVGKSMYSLLGFVGDDPGKLNDIKPDERNSFMSRMYAEGAKAYKEDADARTQIDKLATQSFTLEDPVYRAVYDTCKAWSFEQIDSLVARMGNKPIEKRYLESEADALGVETVHAHEGDVFVKSDGALVFPGSKYGSFDNVFVSSTGRGLYAARDLGLIQLKHRDFPSATKSYIVTAEEQRDYFVGVIKAAELVLPELSGITVNISTGTVKLSTGKMSSRSGDVVDVGWLFDQIAAAVEREGAAVDEFVVTGALRYEFLRARIGSDVIFDVDEAVSVKGNSGPYLQYAHARAKSILAKAKKQDSAPLATNYEKDERSLIRKIGEYPEVLERAIDELMPHHICTYLYELAQKFNSFYEHNRVMGDPRQSVRLELVSLYANTLKDGLELLGIHAPDRL